MTSDNKYSPNESYALLTNGDVMGLWEYLKFNHTEIVNRNGGGNVISGEFLSAFEKEVEALNPLGSFDGMPGYWVHDLGRAWIATEDATGITFAGSSLMRA